MPGAQPLRSKSPVEKIRIAETAATELIGAEAKSISPDWHLRELRATEARIAAGAEKFVDWDTAKKSLRHRTR